MKCVVLGGTGLVGSRLVRAITARGHDAVAASPSSGIDTVTGAGLAEAFDGADAVVDVTNARAFDDRAVREFFERSAGNIATSAAECGVGLDEFVRRYLVATGDRRTVVRDDTARYFGAALDAHGLLPGPGARPGIIRFGDWLRDIARHIDAPPAAST